MKGTFFSADFVADSNNNLRLIEVNTDTGLTDLQENLLDWTDFIGLISASNINTELGRSSSAQFDINGSSERGLAGVASGQISFNNFFLYCLIAFTILSVLLINKIQGNKEKI